MRRLALVALGLALAAPDAGAQEIVRRVGRVTFRVDASQAFPGGVVVVRLAARGRIGSAWALLDGRRRPRIERPAGGGDGLVDIARGPPGNRAHDLFGPGVDDLDRAGPVGGNPGTVDVDVGVVAHGSSLAHRGPDAATEPPPTSSANHALRAQGRC